MNPTPEQLTAAAVLADAQVARAAQDAVYATKTLDTYACIDADNAEGAARKAAALAWVVLAAARAGATDYAIMLARAKARNRGATPAEVQRNVALFETVQS